MRSPFLTLGSSWRFGAVVAGAALSLHVSVGAAESPPESHPAHNHAGTCEQLGEPMIPLVDVVASPEAMFEGPASAHAVEISKTYIDMPLHEIIEGDHAINIHKSSEESGVYIACGDIGGTVIIDFSGRGELFIGLGELNDSGYAGVARLGVEVDPERTEVLVQLVEPDSAR